MKQLFFLKLLCYFLLFIASNYCANSQIQKPGDLSPSAKYIEADRLNSFNLGAALISQGVSNQSTALIDKNGDFIIPYRQHVIGPALHDLYDHSVNSYSKSGYFLLNDKTSYNNTSNILLSTGKIIETQCGSLITNTRLLWGVFRIKQNGKIISNVIVYDPINGQQHDVGPLTTAPDFTKYSCGLAPFQSVPSGKFGYKNIDNKIIIPAKYEQASEFSDGMAVVGARDQNGDLKYGYVDSAGKLSITLTYTRMPEDFYGGVAIVYPKLSADFLWALINKKGEIVQKFGFGVSFSPFRPVYLYGMRHDVNTHVLLQADGKIITDAEFLAKMGIKPNFKFEKDVLTDIDCGDGKIYFKRILSSQLPPPIITGYLDIATGKKMEGPFEEGFYFEKNSRLAYARCTIGKTKAGSDIIREGYINEDGIFVIVKKQQSDF